MPKMKSFTGIFQNFTKAFSNYICYWKCTYLLEQLFVNASILNKDQSKVAYHR